MEEKELQSELASIRSIMERSSKFISLSGLSGILAGIYALIGAGIVYYLQPWLANPESAASYRTSQDSQFGSVWVRVSSELIIELLLIAILVLLASITTAFLMSRRQAKRKDQPMWGSVSRSLLFHMIVPLIAGGALILIFIAHHHYGFISAICLIFYGIALVSASNFTFADVKYLGLCEILLGLIAACVPGYGLLFWAIGFGVLHIIYGARIYLKYDK
jgi:hypothetical protein